MVKHGRNKKRRAGRIGRTKLKNKTFKRWDPNPKFGDKTVQAMWDPSKSPSVNMANLGLLAKPNQDVQRVNQAPVVNPNANVIELFDIPASDNLKKPPRPLGEDDQKYMAKCMSKYGNDYGRMFRDHKLNNMQHTEAKLQKMGARFLLLSPDQRVVDVPSKVQALALKSE